MSTTRPEPVPRKQHRVFLWSFLAVQAVFAAWIIGGIITSAHGAGQYAAGDERNAYEVGSMLGAGLVVFFWAVADVILGIGRWIVLSSRKRHA